SSLEHQTAALGLAVAASFAAYLIGSLSFSLTDYLRRYQRMVLNWASTRSALLRVILISPGLTLEVAGRVLVPRPVGRFYSMVQGWSRDLRRTLDTAGVSNYVYWQALAGELGFKTVDHDTNAADVLLATRVYEERELIADGLLDEKSDLYGAIDRLR